jgi:hypothetical protein
MARECSLPGDARERLDRRVEVLHGQVLKRNGRDMVDEAMRSSGQAHRSRLRQRLHAGGHIHPVAKQVAVTNHRIANMQPDPEADSTLLGNLLMHGGDPLLDTERAFHRFDRA